jgi:hypothetical protein
VKSVLGSERSSRGHKTLSPRLGLYISMDHLKRNFPDYPATLAVLQGFFDKARAVSLCFLSIARSMFSRRSLALTYRRNQVLQPVSTSYYTPRTPTERCELREALLLAQHVGLACTIRQLGWEFKETFEQELDLFVHTGRVCRSRCQQCLRSPTHFLILTVCGYSPLASRRGRD